jgi:hypothetical protein
MTSHALEVTLLINEVIKNDITRSVPLLKLLGYYWSSRGDPLEEADRRDVMLWLYAKTDHCEDSMRRLISEEIPTDQTLLVA